MTWHHNAVYWTKQRFYNYDFVNHLITSNNGISPGGHHWNHYHWLCLILPKLPQYIVLIDEIYQHLGVVFTNISRTFQNIISKFVCCRNRTSCDHFKLKLCLCAQSHALVTRTKFQLEILTINVITGIVYFCEIILKSSRNVSETTPWSLRCIEWLDDNDKAPV